MKFRTEIEPIVADFQLGYHSRIFSIGSCFAEQIAMRLRRAKLHVAFSPTGIVFNPASIAQNIRTMETSAQPSTNHIVRLGNRYVSFDAHSSIYGLSAEECITNLNNAYSEGNNNFRQADTIIITFGTAWVYVLRSDETIVANCHRQPQSLFERRRLSVEEIVAMFEPLMNGILSSKHVIFTVSPVRHIGDGLAGNALSKAVLRVAIDEIVRRHANAMYFPSYEIVTDDLRDYRFYADDLVHPSEQAVDYIWEQFIRSFCSDKTMQTMKEVERIVVASQHRPFDATSKEYHTFCQRNIESINRLPEVDLSSERMIFETAIEHSR